MTDLTMSFSPAARPRAFAAEAARDCSVSLRLCDSGAGALSRPAPFAAPAGIAGEMARARASSPPVASPDFSRFTGCSCQDAARGRSEGSPAVSDIRAGRNERDAGSSRDDRSTGHTKSLPSAFQVRSYAWLQGDSLQGPAWAISQSCRWRALVGGGRVPSTVSCTLAGAGEVGRCVDVEG